MKAIRKALRIRNHEKLVSLSGCSCLHTTGHHVRTSVPRAIYVDRYQQLEAGVSRKAQNPITFRGEQGSKHDIDALYRFTSARWLWREREQLEARYVKFNISELCQVAASAVSSASCVQVVKMSEGHFNKVFLLVMDDGREVIAKLPNPNAGQPHFTTASEVATMDFLRNTLQLPIPQVYAYNSQLSNNSVGAEYIIMEKQPGVMLNDIWDAISGPQKAGILKQVVEIETTLALTKFTKFGSLYYKHDLPQTGTNTPLYVDENGNHIYNTEFEIGPTNHRSFFDFGKAALDIDRGPWSNLEQYMIAIAKREIACVEMGLKYFGMPDGLIYGPRQYQPNALTKLSALNNYLKVAPYVLPKDRQTHGSVLWHGDLHAQNIFVDPDNPTRILGIIDWQSVSAAPLFMQVIRPGFLDFNGPEPETLGKVDLPDDFDSLSPDEQLKAKALRQAQMLHNLYVVRTCQLNPEAFQAMQQKDSLCHQVTVVPSTILMNYEPYLNHLLRDVEKEWPNIVGQGPDGLPLVPCPLHFSAAEIEQQEKDEELWAQGVELMNAFIRDTGVFKHWDGRVSNEDYEALKVDLARGIERFLDREARDESERAEWLKALPFVDHE